MYYAVHDKLCKFCVAPNEQAFHGDFHSWCNPEDFLMIGRLSSATFRGTPLACASACALRQPLIDRTTSEYRLQLYKSDVKELTYLSDHSWLFTVVMFLRGESKRKRLDPGGSPRLGVNITRPAVLQLKSTKARMDGTVLRLSDSAGWFTYFLLGSDIFHNRSHALGSGFWWLACSGSEEKHWLVSLEPLKDIATLWSLGCITWPSDYYMHMMLWVCSQFECPLADRLLALHNVSHSAPDVIVPERFGKDLTEIYGTILNFSKESFGLQDWTDPFLLHLNSHKVPFHFPHDFQPLYSSSSLCWWARNDKQVL